MNVFLSCVSTEFKSYRLRLANQLGALKDHPYEIKVQEDFQQGGYTLLDKLADYIRECDLVIHLAGDACGAHPTAEHVQALYRSLGEVPPDPLPEWSYTQWEYRLALRFQRKMLVYLAAAEAPRDCVLPLQQSADAARLQQAHTAAIKAGGKHYGEFTGYNSVLREVFHDLGLEPEVKVNNLPFKGLGSLFKGREEFLHKMHAALGRVEHRGHQRFAAITASATSATVYGLGGIGKTRAAIEYAHRYAEEYTSLLFVLADSPVRLQQNLAALCGSMVLDLPEKDEKEIQVRVVAVLEWLQQHVGWLLIFDSADTEEAGRAVQELLGRLTTSGQVLVTSRLGNWEGAVESIALGVLAEPDAVAFLLERTETRRRATSDDAEQARTVAVELLGQLPLALEQAGAYIQKHRCTFNQYLDEWREQREKVLEWFDPRLMQYPMSVAVTWQTSFDRLSEHARRLLRILSWFAPDPVPDWLLQARGGPFAVEGADQAESMHGARGALVDLEAHSLVTRADESASFTVHRLVQDVARRNLLRNDEQAYLLTALGWIGQFFVAPEDVRSWPVVVPLASHALSVVNFAYAEGISEPTATLMNQLGLLYLERSQYSEAEHLLSLALTMDEKCYGSDHPRVAGDLNNLGQVLDETTRFGEAEPLYRRALAIYQRSYGPDDPAVAINLNNLALLLLKTNRLAEAEPLMRRALAIDEHNYSPDDPKIAVDLNTLAQLLEETNRLAEAEPLMRRVLVIDEKCYGPDHPKVARALNNLAQLLQETNQFCEAERLKWRVVEITQTAYGPDHPKVAISLNNLALLLKITKRYAEAEPPMRQVVDIFKKAYGPHHPNVAISLNNLASLMLDTNRPIEAEPLYRWALDIDEKAYGPNHPNVARDLNNLGELLKAANRKDEAEPLMLRAVGILWRFVRETGHEHPLLRQAMSNYAGLLKGMGYSEEQFLAKLNEVDGNQTTSLKRERGDIRDVDKL